jgi:hypothetical protein
VKGNNNIPGGKNKTATYGMFPSFVGTSWPWHTLLKNGRTKTRIMNIPLLLTTNLSFQFSYEVTTITLQTMTKDHNSKPPSTGTIAHFPTPSSSFQLACRIWFMPSDEKIASELRRLSVQEREKVWADLSGNEKTSSFRNEVAEDDVIIRAALEDLRREIDDIHIKESLLLTRHQSHYVKDRSFQLMFLRSCDYDGKAAAKLLIDHIDRKRQLFGDETLGRDITRDDMSEHELEIISSGGLGFLQDRDSAGRVVLLSNFSKFRVKERENLVSLCI